MAAWLLVQILCQFFVRAQEAVAVSAGEWEEHTTEEGVVFWFNPQTLETVYDKPGENQGAQPVPVLAEGDEEDGEWEYEEDGPVAVAVDDGPQPVVDRGGPLPVTGEALLESEALEARVRREQAKAEAKRIAEEQAQKKKDAMDSMDIQVDNVGGHVSGGSGTAGTIDFRGDNISVTLGDGGRTTVYPVGMVNVRRKLSSADCFLKYPKRMHRFGKGDARACRLSVRSGLRTLFQQCEKARKENCFGGQFAWGTGTIFVEGKIWTTLTYQKWLMAQPVETRGAPGKTPAFKSFPLLTREELAAAADMACDIDAEWLMNSGVRQSLGKDDDVHMQCFLANFVVEVLLHLGVSSAQFVDETGVRTRAEL